MRRPYDPQVPNRIRKAIEEAWGVGCRAAPWHGDERTAMIRVADRVWRRIRGGPQGRDERIAQMSRALLNAFARDNKTKQMEEDYRWLSEFIVDALMAEPPP